MARLFKWLVRIFVAVSFALIAGIFMVYYLASRSLPDYDASRAVQGIAGPVEIVRDHADVPHVFADSDPDVFFGLGYAHAQDRLWQMMILRRTAQGRLSEVFGARTVEIDELLRRLDIYTLAHEAVAQQDSYTRAALEAYAKGVNAWLLEVNRAALGRGAPEFFLFPAEIAPWQPADSIAVVKLMGVDMGSQLQDEVLRARVSLLLPVERVNDILPDVPGPGIAALPEYAGLFDGIAPREFAALEGGGTPASYRDDPLSPVARRGFGGASNAWAASPKRSASGGTLMANDPHLGFSAPSIWYLARLELASGAVIGGTIPGVPLIMAGRSDGFGWGVTSSYMDDQDLFIEKLNPDNPAEVMTPQGWRPLTTRNTVIRVKGERPRSVTLMWSENGPVLPGHHYDIGLITPPGHVASLSWTLLGPEDRTLSAGMGLMRAKTVAQGLRAGAGFLAPSQNLVLADRNSIAMKTLGAIPRRSVRHQTQGRIPSPGWKAENRWTGYENYASNPEFVAPSGGILGNTNNKIIDRPYPLHVSYSWGDSQRILRWEKLMQAREVHTRESFVEAQLDPVSVTARTLLPLVAADLWFAPGTAPEGSRERARKSALDMLANWNGEMNEHMPEPLLYAAWMRMLQTRLIRDELGPLAQEFTQVEPLFVERVFRNVNGAGVWCDVVQSAPRETCTDIARASLDEALLWISETFGGTLESLRWGDAHEATHDHPVLGGVPFLKWFVNIRQSTSGGDNTLLRGLTKGEGDRPFLNVHGAGYRGVYDFADPDSSVFVIATGQSGHPLSRHYDDLGELWRRGEYVPMTLDPELASAASVGITRLIPAP